MRCGAGEPTARQTCRASEWTAGSTSGLSARGCICRPRRAKSGLTMATAMAPPTSSGVQEHTTLMMRATLFIPIGQPQTAAKYRVAKRYSP